MIKKKSLLLLLHNWSQVSYKCAGIFGMEFRIVLDEKNSDSSLGTSPPSDIDTDSEAKKKEKEKWKYIRLPITGLAAGRNSYQSHSCRAKTTCSNWLNFLTCYTKGGRLMMCKIATSLTHMVCPIPMGHKAKLLTSNYFWKRCFYIFTELRKSRLDAKIIMRHMLAQFLTFCKMSSRSTWW